jgi:zinc protease
MVALMASPLPARTRPIKFLPRAGAAIATAALLLGPAVAAAPVPGQWAQAHSDLPADPDIRFGALPNGMRYAIKRQATPPGQASLRLWIGSGSLDERDDQQGLAHVLEHMAFNGSKAVKEGEMVKILERLGLAFGPDTNAATSFEETVYKLDLAKATPEALDTSLMLFRETASNLTIAQDALDRERGVVLSEERARDTPGYRILKARLAFYMPGQRLPTRLPIGQVEVIKTAPVGLIRDFYSHYYRPERAVLVAVGDFDPAAIEAQVRARFSDWRATTPPVVDPPLGAVQPRRESVRLLIEPGAQLSEQLVWTAPPDLAPDTRAKERRDLIDELGLAVLNRRFSAIARAPSPPFIGAAAGKYQQTRSAEITVVNVTAETGRWREALAAAEQEQRRAVRFGVRQDELDREIVEVRARLRAASEAAATRRPVDIAEEIVGSLPDDEVVTSPADDLRLFEEAVKGLTAAEVSAQLEHTFAGGGPLLFVASPKPIDGAEATLKSALDASRATPVKAPAAPAQLAWPYQSFGPAGRVAERKDVADLGVTFVRFENGVRLTVRPSKLRKDEVLVRADLGRGLLDLPADRQGSTWADSVVIEGGLKKISTEDMDRVLADKLYGARFGTDDEAFALTGGTRTGDLATQLQVLAAYAADPGWRPEAFERLKASGATAHDQYEATDSGVLARDLPGLLHGGDRRWTFPSREAIAGAKLSDLQAEVTPALGQGPIEVLVVGDVDLETAIAQVAATFGALPPRPDAPAVPDALRRTGFPAPNAEPLVLTHKGRADQAIGLVVWPTEDMWADRRRVWATAVMGEVLKNRLTDQLREAEGVTYSPSVTYRHSEVWLGWGFTLADVEVPPDKLQGFFDDVKRITADLGGRPVGDDELARAVRPRVDGIGRAQATNQYWLSELAGAQTDPRRLDLIREIGPGTAAVTAAEVQDAAKRFLREETAFHLVVRPQTP